jgi:hypothetical protein
MTELLPPGSSNFSLSLDEVHTRAAQFALYEQEADPGGNLTSRSY